MFALNSLLAPSYLAARLLNAAQPLFALATRIYVGWQFFKAGWLKVTSWDTTLWLFQNEYHTPVLSPAVAAVLGTCGELGFPIFVWLGFYGRLGSLGLLAVNIMAVVSYAHVLLTEGFEAALGQHILWGFMLLTLAIYGPGSLSLDHLLSRQTRRGAGVAQATPVSV